MEVQDFRDANNPSGVSVESSPRTSINLSFSEQKWAGEDFEFSESVMGFDNDSVTILREVSITEFLPSLSAYTYLSSLRNRRTRVGAPRHCA
jgi:hypothetical protein